MKVLFVPLFTRSGPSSRYRVYQYLDRLKAFGLSVRVVEPPRDSPRHLGYILRITLEAVRADVVFVQKRTFWWVAPLLRLASKRMVYDLDDAMYAASQAPLPLPASKERRLRENVIRIIRLSDEVIVGNRYLHEFASRYSEKVTIIPTVVDTQVYKPLWLDAKPPITIGWVGSPENLVYLQSIADAFRCLSHRHPGEFVLKVVSSDQVDIPGVPLVNQRWQLSSEIEDVQSFDIGIMPLTDNEWTRGKCAFKQLQYMALGLSTVASPVGANVDVIRDGVNGFLAESTDEWVEKLGRLIQDAGLRKRIGQAGRSTVERDYSVESAMPKIVAVLNRVTAQ